MSGSSSILQKLRRSRRIRILMFESMRSPSLLKTTFFSPRDGGGQRCNVHYKSSNLTLLVPARRYCLHVIWTFFYSYCIFNLFTLRDSRKSYIIPQFYIIFDVFYFLFLSVGPCPELYGFGGGPVPRVHRLTRVDSDP